MIWNGGTSSWTWITWCRPTWSRRGSDSGCEVRSRAHAGRSSRRPVWLCRRRFNRSNRRLPAGILRLVPRRLCDCATHGSVRRCYCILSKTSLTISGGDGRAAASPDEATERLRAMKSPRNRSPCTKSPRMEHFRDGTASPHRTPLQLDHLGGQRPVRETCPRETSRPTPGHDRPSALGAWPEPDSREYRRAPRRLLHPLLGTVGGDRQETHARGRRP